MVYICIPAYNEERTIGVVLWKIRQVMADFGRDYEVLVVDDASTDGTAEVMQPYARIMPLHVRRHGRREGYAASLEALVREAAQRSEYPKRDAIVTLQADFTDEPADVATLVKRIEGGADLVTGRLAAGGADASRTARWVRRVWHYLLRRLHLASDAGDVLSGLRAYRVIAVRKAVEEAADEPLVTVQGRAANAQLLARILPHTRRAEAVDVQTRPGRLQRASRFQPWQTSLELFKVMREGPPRTQPRPAEAAGAGSAGSAGDEAAGGGGGRRGGGGDGGRPGRGRGRGRGRRPHGPAREASG